MFSIFEDTANAIVNATADAFDMMMGEGDGLSRKDIATMIEAGMTVGAIAAAYSVSESAIERLIGGDK